MGFFFYRRKMPSNKLYISLNKTNVFHITEIKLYRSNWVLKFLSNISTAEYPCHCIDIQQFVDGYIINKLHNMSFFIKNKQEILHLLHFFPIKTHSQSLLVAADLSNNDVFYTHPHKYMHTDRHKYTLFSVTFPVSLSLRCFFSIVITLKSCSSLRIK